MVRFFKNPFVSFLFWCYQREHTITQYVLEIKYNETGYQLIHLLLQVTNYNMHHRQRFMTYISNCSHIYIIMFVVFVFVDCCGGTRCVYLFFGCLFHIWRVFAGGFYCFNTTGIKDRCNQQIGNVYTLLRILPIQFYQQNQQAILRNRCDYEPLSRLRRINFGYSIFIIVSFLMSHTLHACWLLPIYVRVFHKWKIFERMER